MLVQSFDQSVNVNAVHSAGLCDALSGSVGAAEAGHTLLEENAGAAPVKSENLTDCHFFADFCHIYGPPKGYYQCSYYITVRCIFQQR